MKKIIALTLTLIIAVVAFIGFSNNTKANAVREVTSTSGKLTSEDMVDIYTRLLKSNLYSEWDFVAKSSLATEAHLIKAAKKCARISNSEEWAITIAESICNNPKSTSKVMKYLAKANYFAVINMAAQNSMTDEDTLIKIAKNCARIRHSEEWAITISKSICNNHNSTNRVMKYLAKANYFAVINMAAQNSMTDEDTLIKIAENCARIRHSEEWAKTITESIRKNPNSTTKVIIELR